MNNFSRFIWLLVGSLLAAAILAPWLYLGMKSAADHGRDSLLHPALQYLAGHPFSRYFNRVWQFCVLTGILVGIWKQFQQEGCIRLETLGFSRNRPWKPFLIGLGWSLLIFSGYVAILLAVGWQRSKPIPSVSAGILSVTAAMGTALGVALMEEIFFRGYFFGLCRKGMGNLRAIWINALFFAAVHFVRSSPEHFSNGVNWASGFRMLPLVLRSFAHPFDILGGFLVLMLAAWILCWTVDRTGDIYLAIGLHAGWIMALKFNFAWTQYTAHSPMWMLGGGDLSQGSLTLVPLGLEFLIVRGWLVRKGRREKGEG